MMKRLYFLTLFTCLSALTAFGQAIGISSEVIGPEAKFSITPYGIAPDDILNYSWDFGDSNTSTDATPTHVYSTPGQYRVEVTINYQGATGVTPLGSIKFIVISDFGNLIHIDRAFRQNSMDNEIPVLDGEVFETNGIDDIEIIAGPFNGTASRLDFSGDASRPGISYSPNTDYLGFDIIEYKLLSVGDSVGVSYVYIDVFDKCGFEMDLSSHWSHCPNFCDFNGDGNNDQPAGQPVPGNCWGYTFDLYNVGDETIRSFHATVELDEHLFLDDDSGILEPISTYDQAEADALFNITFDPDQKRVIFELNQGQEILPHQRFQYSFLTQVEEREFEPGRQYNTHFVADVLCDDGTTKTFDRHIIDKEGGACDPNTITVNPPGCGDNGNIGTETTQLTFNIEFQNEGVANASRVFIRDILPAGLDATSVQIIDAEPAMPILQILPPNNEVVFDFTDILLPPISTDSIAGTGHVRFRVDVDTTIADGTSLNNFAQIAFDSQSFVNTDTTTTTFQRNAVPIFNIGPDVLDTDPTNGFDCIPFSIAVEGGSGNYFYNWETNGEEVGFNTPNLTICPLVYLYIDLEVTDNTTGCIGHDRLYVTDTLLQIVGLPGDSCFISNDINSLFGQPVNEPQLSSIWDNTSYTVADSDPTNGTDCFFDSRTAPIWFTFTGDGNRYNIKTDTSGTDNPVNSGDTQFAIYTGECGDLTPLVCSEDENYAAEILNASIDIDTEEGVVYSILVDGTASVLSNGLGEYRIQVTQLFVVNTTEVEDLPVKLYPNPTSGLINIEGITPEIVRITDNYGRLLLESTENTNLIDLSNLPAGVYIIQVGSGDQWATRKVIKN